MASGKLVPISIDSIRIGYPLAFPLMDSEGAVIANKGYSIPDRATIHRLVGRGLSLCIDQADAEAHNRAYRAMLNDMVQRDRSIGRIADAHVTDASAALVRDEEDTPTGPPDWLDYQSEANTILRDGGGPTFLGRITHLHKRLRQHAMRNPDAALLALFHLSTNEVRMYSATHAMLVSVMCGLAARDVLGWPQADELTVSLAALSMNVGMTELQDKLTLQQGPLTPEQRLLVNNHPLRSVELLTKSGVRDKTWLDAVRSHHAAASGNLTDRNNMGDRMARLIQRADSFGARRSPRATRTPSSAAMAMKATYFDENQQVDQAGAALIKAVGIHSPGSFVKLVTDEIAIVVKRGANTTTPKVAVLTNRDGVAIVDPVLRDTAMSDYRIAAGIESREVKVKINLQRILSMTL
jgi:HD-GYP domain-containing protein (c-di-GMP phosphodiesterase class II)